DYSCDSWDSSGTQF
nr:immunoglobulin light chain junction region [Macaca mulatta]